MTAQKPRKRPVVPVISSYCTKAPYLDKHIRMARRAKASYETHRALPIMETEIVPLWTISTINSDPKFCEYHQFTSQRNEGGKFTDETHDGEHLDITENVLCLAIHARCGEVEQHDNDVADRDPNRVVYAGGFEPVIQEDCYSGEPKTGGQLLEGH